MNNSFFSKLLQGRIPRNHLLQIHAQTIISGAHQDNYIATKLIGHYPNHLAILVLRQLQFPNVFPFNAAIRVLSEHSCPSQAFYLFVTLKRLPLSPNDFTFCFLLKALSRYRNPLLVRQVHAQAVKLGFCTDPFVCNGLLNVYSKGVRDLESACKVFDEIPEMEKTSMVCCWTALIAGCAQTGENERALHVFVRMIIYQIKPNSDTMVSVLSACAALPVELVERWINLFERVVRDSCHDSTEVDQIYVALSYLYGKLGNVGKSRASFDEISSVGRQSVVTWNAMINAYVQNGCPSEALSLFRLMRMDYPDVDPNHVTMVSILSACAQIGDINLGIWIHDYIQGKGKIGVLSMNNSLLATAVIDMYSKCGNLRAAEEVFNKMTSKDVVSINAMIMGLAVNGKGDEALSLFDKMSELNLEPNPGTFLGVLYACCHSGMLEKGRKTFQAMKANSSKQPQLEHYACYIDLLARAGCIEEALETVKAMPIEPNNYVWGALLRGCLLHSRIELAREISKNLVEIDPDNSGGYIMLSNSLATDCKWNGVYNLRGLMRDKGVKKHPGCSWINVDGILHQFLAGLPSHPELDKICCMLEILQKEMQISSALYTAFNHP